MKCTAQEYYLLTKSVDLVSGKTIASEDNFIVALDYIVDKIKQEWGDTVGLSIFAKAAMNILCEVNEQTTEKIIEIMEKFDEECKGANEDDDI